MRPLSDFRPKQLASLFKNRIFPQQYITQHSAAIYSRLFSSSPNTFLTNTTINLNMNSNTELVMIPGPIEVENSVLQAMATKTTSHTDPRFIACFSNLLKNLRVVFGSTTAQPFVIAGSGTLGWDQTAANLLEQGDNVLLLSNGYFGDSFGDCLEVYGGNVTRIAADMGHTFKLDQVEAELASKNYKMVTITQVDTSTGVLADVEGVCNIVRKVSPHTLIVVDSVCSGASERLYFDKWGVDVVICASQKALGCPPGLSVVIVSQRALETVNNRKSNVQAYYVSWKRWLPVMISYEEKRPSYFATPCVQTVLALNESVQSIVNMGMETVFKRHEDSSARFVSAITNIGLKIVPASDSIRSHAMTAIWLPQGVALPDLIPKMFSRGIVVAGGIIKGRATEYFRVGHMGISATHPDTHHIEITLKALDESLVEAGFKPNL